MAAGCLAQIAVACAIATLTLLPPGTASAHGLPPLTLALWGPFPAATVDCLRQLGHATQRCFNTALAAYRRCVETALDGGDCDAGARDATIAAARARAAAAVDASCRGGQLTELRFANADDARNDIRLACGEADTALRMIYAPALNRVQAPTLSRDDRHCIAHVGTAAAKLLMATIHEHRRVFEAVAVHILLPSQRFERLHRAQARLAAAHDQMAGRMDAACAGATVYDGDPAAVLAHLERRSACVLSAVYFIDHPSATCPAATCGDGIVDGAEECDDGNGVDADGCGSDCRLQ